ncbi:COP9 signalosome complex subunit 6a [Micractinium conductrix]|uniref:COP9 signalosome complex subunit 6 n=1 Tax=Micractinium conductrix TaxID=554055 RepID=A0A2P6VID7_9CHLO|nr:COP9 signalosome complex subunit 6a [Micractinium conductrix]|eukprot:PSC73827.1 COP9 signalosome complex subunit 6a [Micractinium conductrix]
MQVDPPEHGADHRASTSGLQFQLHPLVLINISDHHTRMRANAGGAGPSTSGAGGSGGGAGGGVRVMGCLLGQQSGRTVDISNSFEMQLAPGSASGIDESFLQRKMEQYKQTFPQQDVVGWYATGTELSDADMAIQRKLMDINESPVFLRLDPSCEPSRKDLPVYLYESELHVLDGVPSFIFVQAKYTVETSEAERIGVDQVAKILPTGAATGTNQLTAHLSSMHSAIKMLITRVALLHQMLEKMQSGELPFDHELVRQAAGLIKRLPAVDSQQFGADYTTELNDALLSTLLAAVTKGAAACNEIVDKCNLAFDRVSLKGGRKGGGGGGGGMGSTIGLGLPMGLLGGAPSFL